MTTRNEEIAAKRAEALAKLTQADATLKIAVDAVLRTEEGCRVFMYLFHICGWSQADIPRDNLGRVENDTLLYNAARRTVYAKLRALASRELLTLMEEMAETRSLPSLVATASENEGGK